MTTDTYAKLRELAEKADANSARAWYVEGGGIQVRDGCDDFVCDTGEVEPVIADYIAAAEPAAILGLLATLDRQAETIAGMEQRLREAEADATELRARLGKCVPIIDALMTCEEWFEKWSPTADLINGGVGKHPMLHMIGGALEGFPDCSGEIKTVRDAAIARQPKER